MTSKNIIIDGIKCIQEDDKYYKCNNGIKGELFAIKNNNDEIILVDEMNYDMDYKMNLNNEINNNEMNLNNEINKIKKNILWMSKGKVLLKNEKHYVESLKNKSKLNEIDDYEKNGFIGIDTNNKHEIKNKNDWKKCFYCEKYHHLKYYFLNLDYCVHCWGWLNSCEYNEKTNIYTGTVGNDELNKMIKMVYPIHLEITCKNDGCIFTKIKQSIDNNTCHPKILDLLKSNKKKLETTIFDYKKRDLDVNYEESYISI